MIWSVILGNFFSEQQSNAAGSLAEAARLLYRMPTRARTCSNSIAISVDSVEHSFSSSLITALWSMLINAREMAVPLRYWNGWRSPQIGAHQWSIQSFQQNANRLPKKSGEFWLRFPIKHRTRATLSVWRQRLTGCQRMVRFQRFNCKTKFWIQKIFCEFN